MKLKLIFAVTLSAFALAVSSATAQTTAVTKPVGYHTITINGKTDSTLFNYLGTNFVTKILAAGQITGEGASTITDANADFSVLDGTLNPYVEITSGANEGANSPIASYTGTELTTTNDLSSFLASGDTYVVRDTNTIGGIFGEFNEAGLKGGFAAAADVIWVSLGGGNFEQYYYLNVPIFGGPGWRGVNQGLTTDTKNDPVYFTDGIYVERKAITDPADDPLELVITGHVKTTPAMIPILEGFNYIERVFPVGATLENSMLYDPSAAGGTLTPGFAGTADIVWMLKPGDPDKNFDQYYYYDGAAFGGPGWRKVPDLFTIVNSAPLESGLIIQRKAIAATPGTDDFNLVIKPPSFYGDL